MNGTTLLLFLAPIALIAAAGYRTLRHSVFSEKWRPPSSRLTLIAVLASFLLLARAVFVGLPFAATFFFGVSAASSLYAYICAVRAEANHAAWERNRTELDG